MPVCNIRNEKLVELQLKGIIQRYGIDDMAEYSLDSQIGCRLDILYKNILEELLNTSVWITGDEITKGSYRLKVFVNDNTYLMHSKGSFTRDDVLDILMGFVVIPYLRDKH